MNVDNAYEVHSATNHLLSNIQESASQSRLQTIKKDYFALGADIGFFVRNDYKMLTDFQKRFNKDRFRATFHAQNYAKALQKGVSLYTNVLQWKTQIQYQVKMFCYTLPLFIIVMTISFVSALFGLLVWSVIFAFYIKKNLQLLKLLALMEKDLKYMCDRLGEMNDIDILIGQNKQVTKELHQKLEALHALYEPTILF